MASKPTSKINNKIDFKSCAGIVIGVFFISTIIIAAAGLLWLDLIDSGCWETCPLMVITISPWIGGVIAIIAGIVGGRKAYKEKEKYIQLSQNVKTRDNKLHNTTETARILRGFLNLNTFCSECGFKVLFQNAEHCPNCERKFI